MELPFNDIVSFNEVTISLSKVVDIIREASAIINTIYNCDNNLKSQDSVNKVSIKYKEDKSPVTNADLRANQYIVEHLQKLTSNVPIVSEESSKDSYSERHSSKLIWLVDPLDGTKEFIKRNGEFTVNIALCYDHKPVLGVLSVPDKNLIYFASVNTKAYKLESLTADIKTAKIISPQNSCGKKSDKLRVVITRSHGDTITQRIIEHYENIELKRMGSSYKLVLIAEGVFDVSIRFQGCYEWDTAAAHAILLSAGCEVSQVTTDYRLNDIKQFSLSDLNIVGPLTYNKQDLLSPFYVAYRNNLLKN